jgi:sortase A
MNDTDYESFFAVAEKYNETLLGRDDTRYTMTEEEEEEYNSLLDISGTGIIGYVEIDKINVELPIYHGIEDTVLQIATGHLPGTSLPVGGKGTHSVICGHRGLPSASLFTNLDQLEEGDTFVVHVLNETLTYEVDQVLIVEPEDTTPLEIEPDKDLCTLLTCTPYGINTQRLLVRGHRVANAASTEDLTTADAKTLDPVMVAPLVAAPILVILLIALLVRTKKKADNPKKGGKDDET